MRPSGCLQPSSLLEQEKGPGPGWQGPEWVHFPRRPHLSSWVNVQAPATTPERMRLYTPQCGHLLAGQAGPCIGPIQDEDKGLMIVLAFTWPRTAAPWRIPQYRCLVIDRPPRHHLCRLLVCRGLHPGTQAHPSGKGWSFGPSSGLMGPPADSCVTGCSFQGYPHHIIWLACKRSEEGESHVSPRWPTHAEPRHYPGPSSPELFSFPQPRAPYSRQG